MNYKNNRVPKMFDPVAGIVNGKVVAGTLVSLFPEPWIKVVNRARVGPVNSLISCYSSEVITLEDGSVWTVMAGNEPVDLSQFMHAEDLLK